MTKFRFHTFMTSFLLYAIQGFSQKDPAWDDTQSKNWPAEAVKVAIPSSVDAKVQPAYFYKAPSAERRPLIVSLHTWSGDYQQKDTLVHFCIRNGFHYIHPHFRGPNQTREALGSDQVVSDIEDAISYSLSNAAVDPRNIHVMGVSGGGHAAVLTYMKSKHDIRSFSAYVGIYNLLDWYHESLGRKNKYAGDIAAATSGDRNLPDLEEARKRSPSFMDTPLEKRKNSTLYLYTGIHDGYTGSVPVSQTLKLYNKVVKDFGAGTDSSLVPENYIQTMLSARSLPEEKYEDTFLGRKIIYRNGHKDLVRLIVFEGTHEMPPGNVLSHVPALNILAIGDSNGAREGGWADQLKDLRPQDKVVNTCISGNTIGFDNLKKEELNTLRNIEKYIGKAQGPLDVILLMLGTNDCKAIFSDSFGKVPGNLDQLIEKVKTLLAEKPALGKPEIYIISPPPIRTEGKLAQKYKGADERVEILSEEFRRIALKNNVHYVDSYSRLKPVFPSLTTDGVHLSEEGQRLLAEILIESITAAR